MRGSPTANTAPARFSLNMSKPGGSAAKPGAGFTITRATRRSRRGKGFAVSVGRVKRTAIRPTKKADGMVEFCAPRPSGETRLRSRLRESVEAEGGAEVGGLREALGVERDSGRVGDAIDRIEKTGHRGRIDQCRVTETAAQGRTNPQ